MASPTTSYLRPNQVEELNSEKGVLEGTIRDAKAIGVDTTQHRMQLQRIDSQIDAQAPPDLTGEQRDQAVRECAEIEADLQPKMPSHEAMRKNPPGTIGRHGIYDAAAKTKSLYPEGSLRRWKNNMLAIHKGSTDPDIANFERLRPTHDMTSMLGAQIPGTQYHGTSPSPEYLANYENVDWSKHSKSDETATATASTVPVESVSKVDRRKPMKCGELKDPRGRAKHEGACKACQAVIALQE